MILRFRRPRDRSEQIFHGAGHVQHAVGFEFAEVDDHVRLIEPGGIVKGFEALRPGENCALHSDIHVQMHFVTCKRLQPAGMVNAPQRTLCEQAARAVAENYHGALFYQAPAKLADERRVRRNGPLRRRVRRNGPLRRRAGQKIQFDRHCHPGLYKIQHAKRQQKPVKCCAHGFRIVVFACGKRYRRGVFSNCVILHPVSLQNVSRI